MQCLVRSYENFNDIFQFTNENILPICQDMHSPNGLGAIHVNMETLQFFLKYIFITNTTFIQCNNNLIIATKFGNIMFHEASFCFQAPG